MKLIIAIILLTIGIIFLTLAGYCYYKLATHLIQYNADCQDRYIRKRKLEKDLEDLENELEYMKDYDWSKEDK